MELLDLSSCKSNKEVSLAIKERVLSVGINELMNELNKSFVFHESATRKLYAALVTGSNALLHGPGGFGKSVLVKAVCEVLGLPVIYKIGFKGMMPDELLGVPNMKALLEESRYETAFENSLFSKPGILILEEFLDADPSTAAALKDVLTDKGFREGNTRKESLISNVIITGNKDPEIISQGNDDSLTAFYLERFPYRHNMIWERFREEDYLKFLKIYFSNEYESNKDVFTLVSRLCAGTNKFVSPRVATQASEAALNLGVDYLDTISGLDTSMITDIKYQMKHEALFNREEKLLSSVQKEVITCIDELGQNDVSKAIITKTKLQIIEKKLSEISFSDSSFVKLGKIGVLIEHGLRQCESNLATGVDSLSIDKDMTNLFRTEDEEES